jgi:hypothetical protein
MPLFASGMARGSRRGRGEAGRKYVMASASDPSGRPAFRVRCGESFQPRGEIADELRAQRSQVERPSRNFLAVDAVRGHAQLAADFRAERERLSTFQSARSSIPRTARADRNLAPTGFDGARCAP